MHSCLDNFYYILIEPQMGENIGAAARIMDNFGFGKLRLVNPREPWPNTKAQCTAAHAEAIVNSAQLYSTLDEAIYDLNLVIATSSKKRALNIEQINIVDLGSCFDYSSSKIGILFGRERTGLLNEELAYADKLVYINTNTSNPSINLSHAVAIIAYEISRYQQTCSPVKKISNTTKGQLSSFIERTINDLKDYGFFTVKDKEAQMQLKVRNLLSKLAYEEQELKLLMGMFNAFKKRNRNSNHD